MVQEKEAEYINSPAKRKLDIVGGLAIVSASSSTRVALALWRARRHSTLWPLFVQERPGRDGELFSAYKFQSLDEGEPDADHIGGSHHPRALSGDIIFRRSGMDELPQIINVLRGDLSLVGLRPSPPEALDEYRAEINETLFDEWYGRYKQNPGLTGEGQLYSHRYGVNSREVITRRMEIESFDSASMQNDIQTLLRTPLVVLRNMLLSPPDLQANPGEINLAN
jgi:lipopolysaccharide/colanic/teichoic acid biosynthesis glycosyltransferase